MTESEAVRLAQTAALALDWPWDAGGVVARRRRIWPLPATWRVVSHMEERNAIVTVLVDESRGTAYPLGIVYPARRGDTPHPRAGRWRSRQAASFLLGAAVVLAIARLVLGWPLWVAVPVALFWGWLATIVLLSARARPAPREPDEDGPTT